MSIPAFLHSLLIFSILFLGGLIGCASSPEPRVSYKSNLTPQAVQLKVKQNARRLRSFQGKARVIIELPGSGNSGFSEVFVRLPDSLFVKTEAILGIDIGALFVDSKNFGAYAPRENTLYYGETELLDLKDFLEIELSTVELWEVVTGLTRVHVDSSSRLGFDDGKYLISTKTDDGSIKYWIDMKKNLVLRSEIENSAGEPILTKEFKRVRKENGVYLPQLIRVTRPEERERITVYYTRQKVNQKISSDKFRLKTASNARRVYWGNIEKPKLDRRKVAN